MVAGLAKLPAEAYFIYHSHYSGEEIKVEGHSQISDPRFRGLSAHPWTETHRHALKWWNLYLNSGHLLLCSEPHSQSEIPACSVSACLSSTQPPLPQQPAKPHILLREPALRASAGRGTPPGLAGRGHPGPSLHLFLRRLCLTPAPQAAGGAQESPHFPFSPSHCFGASV